MLLVLLIFVEIRNILFSSREAQVAAHSPWFAILPLVCTIQHVIVCHFSISALLISLMIRQLMYCRVDIMSC